MVKINKVHLVRVFIAVIGKMESQHSGGRCNRHTECGEKPEARFEFVSLGSYSCLTAAHFLSLHHAVAGIGYDTWPPRRYQGSHLLRLLRFVSDTFCARRQAWDSTLLVICVCLACHQ